MSGPIILWLSRHTPTVRQLAELERLYPGHDLKIDKRSFDSADDIVTRYKDSGATDMVVVAPLSFVRELVRRGLHPLWAEMRQVTRGSPQAETSNNGRSYRFVKFNRIRSIEVKLDEVLPSTQTNKSGTIELSTVKLAALQQNKSLTEAGVGDAKSETVQVHGKGCNPLNHGSSSPQPQACRAPITPHKADRDPSCSTKEEILK